MARIKFMQADFADPNAPSSVIAAAARAFGHVDMLIANHAYGWLENGISTRDQWKSLRRHR